MSWHMSPWGIVILAVAILFWQLSIDHIVNGQYKRYGFAKTHLRHPSRPFDTSPLPYPYNREFKIRRPPRSTLSSSSAASDVYKRQGGVGETIKRKGGVSQACLGKSTSLKDFHNMLNWQLSKQDSHWPVSHCHIGGSCVNSSRWRDLFGSCPLTSCFTSSQSYSISYFLAKLTTPENTITYHNALCLSPQSFA